MRRRCIWWRWLHCRVSLYIVIPVCMYHHRYYRLTSSYRSSVNWSLSCRRNHVSDNRFVCSPLCTFLIIGLLMESILAMPLKVLQEELLKIIYIIIRSHANSVENIAIQYHSRCDNVVFRRHSKPPVSHHRISLRNFRVRVGAESKHSWVRKGVFSSRSTPHPPLHLLPNPCIPRPNPGTTHHKVILYTNLLALDLKTLTEPRPLVPSSPFQTENSALYFRLHDQNGRFCPVSFSHRVLFSFLSLSPRGSLGGGGAEAARRTRN